jgi:hypothetical protein
MLYGDKPVDSDVADIVEKIHTRVWP